MVKLDLACGNRKEEGHTGVDIAAIPGVDVVHDLTKTPWPFEDSSVDQVLCQHFVEHLTGEELMRFMNELHRVMKAGAKANISAPYYASRRAMQDPTHKSLISESSFLYYNAEWRKLNLLEHYPITADFDFSYAYNITSARWANASDESKMFAINHYLNVVDDILVTLVKK